ncbi:MAG: ABC transporter substrate-binding protein [Acidobacteriota bacterium]|nr:MAG: ABC transporter substrate-binding protein [Acidobacteriota bacterium]
MTRLQIALILAVLPAGCALQTEGQKEASTERRIADATNAFPQRICSVSLAGDELLSLLVDPERIVCLSAFADEAEISNAAGQFPSQIPRLTARIEPVLSQAPDFVLAAQWNDRGFLDLLGRAGIHAEILEEVHEFDGIRDQLIELGRKLGVSDRASEQVSAFDRKLEALDRALAGLTGYRPSVLAFSHLVVSGERTTVNALIRRAGGTNAAAALGVVGHRKLSLEQLLALDPDVLLLGFDPRESLEALLAAHPHLATTRAAREGRVIVLAPRYLTTVTPFLADGAWELARTLHPERFDAVSRKPPEDSSS